MHFQKAKQLFFEINYHFFINRMHKIISTFLTVVIMFDTIIRLIFDFF